MTRGQIKSTAAATARAYLRSADEVDPVLYDRWVDFTTIDLCRHVESIYLNLTTDIVSGQGPYCLPDLFYVERVEAVMADGNALPMTILTTARMNEEQSNWRTHPAPNGSPRYAVTEGTIDVILYPAPNYDATGGLTMRGNGTITNVQWPADTTECPLPERTHETIVNGIIARHFRWAKDVDSAAEYDRLFRAGRGKFEREVATLTEAERSRSRTDMRRRGWGGPLNMW